MSNRKKFTVQEICRGFQYADYEPSELPEKAERYIGKQLDWYDEEYWKVVDEFWETLPESASESQIRAIYDMVPKAREIVERGLEVYRRSGDDESSCSGSDHSCDHRDAPKSEHKSEKHSGHGSNAPKGEPKSDKNNGALSGEPKSDKPRDDAPKEAALGGGGKNKKKKDKKKKKGGDVPVNPPPTESITTPRVQSAVESRQ